MRLIPTRFEVVEESLDQLEATIELAEDRITAKIDIKTCQNSASWSELAVWVTEALKLMDLDDAPAVVHVHGEGDPDEYDQV